jgi:multiple sugar transport system permease protein
VPLSSRLLNDQRIVAALFLAPTVIVLACVVLYPFGSAIVLSFQHKYAGASAKWVGLANYRELFADPVFRKVIWNTIVYTVAAVAIKFALGLGMAMVLNQPRRLDYLWRTLLFVPWAVPTIVTGLNFRWIYDDFSGMLNNVLIKVFGMQGVISWLGDPNLAMGSVVAVVIWAGTPFYTMSFLAGLKGIPKELYEAARIDANTTQILPNLSYKYALLAGRLGIGSAVNMVFFPLLALLIYLLSRRMLAERS